MKTLGKANVCPIFISASLISLQQKPNQRKFLRASKALREPLTTSG
uniref:Uncharacterized protein n=1 Tax=Heterorhabditis bacteriophora TaxID=37862 RepID=A0A1I7XCG8_HETBA